MNVLSDLLTAAAQFSLEAVEAVGPQRARRLAAMEISVAVATEPARARVLAVAPDGDVAVVHQAAVPAPLGEAVASFLSEALATLSPEATRALAGLQAAGQGRLGVLVERDAGAAHVLVDAGEALPRRLVTLQADLGQAH